MKILLYYYFISDENNLGVTCENHCSLICPDNQGSCPGPIDSEGCQGPWVCRPITATGFDGYPCGPGYHFFYLLDPSNMQNMAFKGLRRVMQDETINITAI